MTPAFRDMPQFVAESLREAIGGPVVVKAETPNPIGCFQGRGTWLAVDALAAAGAVGERTAIAPAGAGAIGFILTGGNLPPRTD